MILAEIFWNLMISVENFWNSWNILIFCENYWNLRICLWNLGLWGTLWTSKIMIFAWEVLHFWENHVFPFRSRSGGFFSVISLYFPQFLVDFGVFFLNFRPQNTLLGPPGRWFLGVRKFAVSGLGFFKDPGHVSRAFWAFWGRPGGSGTVFWPIFRAF